MESYVKGKIPQIIFGSKSAQKVSGLLKKYEIKKCLLVTGHHVVRHSITQNVIKALSVEGIHCDVFDRVTPEPTDTLCLEMWHFHLWQMVFCLVNTMHNLFLKRIQTIARLCRNSQKILMRKIRSF